MSREEKHREEKQSLELPNKKDPLTLLLEQVSSGTAVVRYVGCTVHSILEPGGQEPDGKETAGTKVKAPEP